MKISNILILLIILLPKIILSNTLFDTQYYNIEITSDNIENDKVKKINEIKNDSISKILIKTLSNENYQKIKKKLSQDLINTFVKNILIDEEKIIENKYFSKIKVNFNKKKIVNYYYENNIPYVPYHPENILLIVFENGQITNNLFTNKNNYYLYFKKNYLKHNLFKIPNLDINDRFILSKDDLIKKNIDKIKKFSKKYDTQDVMVVLVDSKNKKVKYNFLLISDDYIHESNLVFDQQNFENFFKVLEHHSLDMWKKINKIDMENLNIIKCNLKYYNLSELKEIRKNLDNIITLNNIKIRSLSYKKTNYDMYFFGSLNMLQKLFYSNNLNLKNLDKICSIGLR